MTRKPAYLRVSTTCSMTCRSKTIYCYDLTTLTGLIYKISTSVLLDRTSAVLMLCAITPTDHTTVLAIRDTMETAGIVIQVFFRFLTLEEKFQGVSMGEIFLNLKTVK